MPPLSTEFSPFLSSCPPVCFARHFKSVDGKRNSSLKGEIIRGIFIFVSARGRPEAGMNEEASAGEEDAQSP